MRVSRLFLTVVFEAEEDDKKPNLRFEGLGQVGDYVGVEVSNGSRGSSYISSLISWLCHRRSTARLWSSKRREGSHGQFSCSQASFHYIGLQEGVGVARWDNFGDLTAITNDSVIKAESPC